MEESGATQVSLTDPDSRRMRKVGVGYNGQISLDAKHKLIAVAEAVNEPTDIEKRPREITKPREVLARTHTIYPISASAGRPFDDN